MAVPSDKLAHYEIIEPIGRNGTGEVYRARDGKLGRDVAIKVLPDEFAQDEERLARFKREAQVLASLNHPNVAAIYGLEQSESTHFLVLELVEGETLAERISRGPIPIDEAVPLLGQVAEGLEASHEKGIVHRNLKPANIKIGPYGKPKVLDFGLAKAFAAEDSTARDASQSPTLTRGTTLGAIIGTTAYMSPEQAKGQALDQRTDVWPFGCVLFEMLTGNKPFEGETVTDILASVVKSEPDWSLLPEDAPFRVRDVLRRCLKKSPGARLPTRSTWSLPKPPDYHPGVGTPSWRGRFLPCSERPASPSRSSPARKKDNRSSATTAASDRTGYASERIG